MPLSFVRFPSFAGSPVRAVMAYAGDDHTSQLSKIKHRLAVTDLSGGKMSAESFTPRRSNFAVSYAVDFQFPLGTNTYLLIRYMSSKLQTNGKKTSLVITLQMLGFFRIY